MYEHASCYKWSRAVNGATNQSFRGSEVTTSGEPDWSTRDYLTGTYHKLRVNVGWKWSAAVKSPYYSKRSFVRWKWTTESDGCHSSPRFIWSNSSGDIVPFAKWEYQFGGHQLNHLLVEWLHGSPSPSQVLGLFVSYLGRGQRTWGTSPATPQLLLQLLYHL